jgi:hypothetical protein
MYFPKSILRELPPPPFSKAQHGSLLGKEKSGTSYSDFAC